MGYQVKHPLEEGHLGAKERVSGCFVSNIFLLDAIILGCELQRDKVGGLEFACCGCGCKYAADETEVSVFEGEWCAP